MHLKIIILVLFPFFNCGNCEYDEPTVETPSGNLRGYHKVSHGGRKFAAFEGIPYAKPPIGQRRFEAAEPLEPWSGVLEATFLYECTQIFANNGSNVAEGMTIAGDEDCLYLNIYVPRDYPNPREKLDVIVHIHGGGFVFGNGHFYAKPGYLMDRDVIVVTFNYRLGIFGFLSTEDDVLPGNNGLKDQVMALKWVKNNIASFGGNPDSVTITGFSAGASSVHLHYLSDMSKGLFHRGVSHSCTALNPFNQRNASTRAKMLATAVGCPDSPSEKLVTCLKGRSYQQILNKTTHFFGYKFEPAVTFGLVVEKGSKPFLADDPNELLRQGRVQDLPWLVSNTAHEGKFITAYDFNDNIEEINADWEKSAPFTLYYNYTISPAKWVEVAKKIKEYYLGRNGQVTKHNFHDLIKIFTDRLFIYHGTKAARLQAAVTTSPVYYYNFNYPGDFNNTYVEHGEDMQYFYSDFVPEWKPTENELKMKDAMLDMLISFLKTGKPTIDGVAWEPTKSDQLTFLDISGFASKDMELKRVQHLGCDDFWKSVGLEEEPFY